MEIPWIDLDKFQEITYKTNNKFAIKIVDGKHRADKKKRIYKISYIYNKK